MAASGLPAKSPTDQGKLAQDLGVRTVIATQGNHSKYDIGRGAIVVAVANEGDKERNMIARDRERVRGRGGYTDRELWELVM